MPLSFGGVLGGTEDEEDEVKVEFRRTGVSHLYRH